MHMSMHMSVHMFVHMSIHIPDTRLHTCLCTCLHTCLYAYLAHVYTHVYLHFYRHVHTHHSKGCCWSRSASAFVYFTSFRPYCTRDHIACVATIAPCRDCFARVRKTKALPLAAIYKARHPAPPTVRRTPAVPQLQCGWKPAGPAAAPATRFAGPVSGKSVGRELLLTKCWTRAVVKKVLAGAVV